MSINIKDLPSNVRTKIKGVRMPSMTAAEVSKHAIAVAAMLRDDRNLKPSDAARVLRKALLIV